MWNPRGPLCPYLSFDHPPDPLWWVTVAFVQWRRVSRAPCWDWGFVLPSRFWKIVSVWISLRYCWTLVPKRSIHVHTGETDTPFDLYTHQQSPQSLCIPYCPSLSSLVAPMAFCSLTPLALPLSSFRASCRLWTCMSELVYFYWIQSSTNVELIAVPRIIFCLSSSLFECINNTMQIN